MKAAVVRCLLA